MPDAALNVLPPVLLTLLLLPLTVNPEEALLMESVPDAAFNAVLMTALPVCNDMLLAASALARVRVPASGVVALSVVPAVMPLRVRLPVAAVTPKDELALPPMLPV